MKPSTTNVLILVGIFLLVTSMLLFFIGPELIKSRYFDVSDSAERGQMGDSFGGTVGPVIAWIAATLTFAAFYIQYEANREQRIQFGKQANDTVIERFENRFFELLRLHRENVEEQNIQDKIKGRKVFTTYYFELRYIYLVLESMHDNNPPLKGLDKRELTNLAYLVFFFGIGHVTKSVFEHIAPKYIKELFFIKTLDRLGQEKNEYKKTISETEAKTNTSTEQLYRLGDLIIEHKGKKAVFMQVYQPFTGHGTKIGHYYRHLFQTVKYVSTQEHEVFTQTAKYSYVKILRAQLSNFEQVLFYYNAMSLLGQDWIDNKYITDYKLIVNLPLSFADFGIEPEEAFKEEILNDGNFFDWNSFKNRLS